ncbi:MAG: pyridoxal 5'-phosphate synthase glutaminase subunit PdxT [Crenarchaeota archaeon]|nr:pyridoxal 5'-phosphate synthase glutaminase subunit PdxT [Thermoproteota archaeon]MDA1124942.1 pyridoxal 5'-phosphate synthase glutaminase subunit PdxT [Thermoproteota archaeon]
MSKIQIGILAVQGDVTENFLATMASMSELGIDGTVIQVKTTEQISELDGLIIPGGESTVIGQMSLVNGGLKKIKEKIESGMPVFGICAGMILLSKNSKDKVVGKVEQPLLDVLDVKIERNSFGRQKNSFEANISMEPIGISSFNGVFIRAPSVSETGSDVKILAKFNEKIVAVKQGNILATAFHPELTSDISLHKLFVKLVANLS